MKKAQKPGQRLSQHQAVPTDNKRDKQKPTTRKESADDTEEPGETQSKKKRMACLSGSENQRICEECFGTVHRRGCQVHQSTKYTCGGRDHRQSQSGAYKEGHGGVEQSRSSAIRMQCRYHQSQLISSDGEDGSDAGI